MRDPNRIKTMCDRLEMIWSTVPDWRFGQLLENVRREIAHNGRDIFFMEDEELFVLMEYMFYPKGDADGL